MGGFCVEREGRLISKEEINRAWKRDSFRREIQALPYRDCWQQSFFFYQNCIFYFIHIEFDWLHRGVDVT